MCHCMCLSLFVRHCVCMSICMLWYLFFVCHYVRRCVSVCHCVGLCFCNTFLIVCKSYFEFQCFIWIFTNLFQKYINKNNTHKLCHTKKWHAQIHIYKLSVTHTFINNTQFYTLWCIKCPQRHCLYFFYVCNTDYTCLLCDIDSVTLSFFVCNNVAEFVYVS